MCKQPHSAPFPDMALRIPKPEVVEARDLHFCQTGELVSLKTMEAAMQLEGLLDD